MNWDLLPQDLILENIQSTHSDGDFTLFIRRKNMRPFEEISVNPIHLSMKKQSEKFQVRRKKEGRITGQVCGEEWISLSSLDNKRRSKDK
jgi:hypothetical protein